MSIKASGSAIDVHTVEIPYLLRWLERFPAFPQRSSLIARVCTASQLWTVRHHKAVSVRDFREVETIG